MLLTCRYAHPRYTVGMDINWKDLAREIACRLRNASWRGVWEWLTYGKGMRLFTLAVIALYLAIEYGS